MQKHGIKTVKKKFTQINFIQKYNAGNKTKRIHLHRPCTILYWAEINFGKHINLANAMQTNIKSFYEGYRTCATQLTFQIKFNKLNYFSIKPNLSSSARFSSRALLYFYLFSNSDVIYICQLIVFICFIKTIPLICSRNKIWVWPLSKCCPYDKTSFASQKKNSIPSEN